MILRRELEDKAAQISKVAGIPMTIQVGNKKMNIIGKNKGLYSGDIVDCYNYLEGFLGAVSIMKEVNSNVSY